MIELDLEFKSSDFELSGSDAISMFCYGLGTNHTTRLK